MSAAAEELPYLDEHATVIPAPPDVVWAALRTFTRAHVVATRQILRSVRRLSRS